MSTEAGFMHVAVLISLLLVSLKVNSLPCDSTRCRTGSCDTTGACICSLPDPSTILDGDRPFLGGRFCDEAMTMCDGTNEFWCEHGGKCEEIVQGERYSCKCPPGYAGDRCEHSGEPCSRTFCFHGAECLAEGDVCHCPSDWKGSTDCSLPTEPTTDDSSSSISTRSPPEGSNNNKNVVLGLVISCSVVAVAGAAIYAKRFFSKKDTAKPRFQQLSQTQTHRVLDEDEDDPTVPSMIQGGDRSHL